MVSENDKNIFNFNKHKNCLKAAFNFDKLLSTVQREENDK